MATFLGAFESFLTQRTENTPSEAVEGKSHVSIKLHYLTQYSL